MPFCHNCGTQLEQNARFCPSCGTAFRGDQPLSQQIIEGVPSSAATSSTQTFQNAPPSTIQQNVVIMGKQKSVGVAFLLAFLLGPLGLLYATVIGGFVMFFISLVLFFLLPIVGAILCWIACIIWAVLAADQANKSLINSGKVIISKELQSRQNS